MNEIEPISDAGDERKGLPFLKRPWVVAVFAGLPWLLIPIVHGCWRDGVPLWIEGIVGFAMAVLITYVIFDWKNRKRGT